MTELNLILVIAIGLFVLYLINCGANMNAFASKKKLPFQGEQQATTHQVNSDVNMNPANPQQGKEDSEDNYQTILMTSVVDGVNGTGIISSNNVNTGLLLGDDNDPEINKYKLSYQDIVENEIGQDNIKSQKQYSKYIKSDSAMRYLDRDISSNYGNFYGLSLTRSMDRGNKISATNSTQIQSINVSDFDTNSANLRDFFIKK